MKRIFFLLLLTYGVVLSAFAQSSVPAQPELLEYPPKPKFHPDWIVKAPRPTNSTYLYVVESGEGKNENSARNRAIARVFQSTANRIGVFFSTSEVNRAVQSGQSWDVISRNMKVPIHKVCEFPREIEENHYKVYVLCQVAVKGNITPQFDYSDECDKHTIYDKRKARWERERDSIEKINKKIIHDYEKAIEDHKRKANAGAFVASTFIPGMGQMIKKHGGAGAAFLISELALAGGGTACYFVGKEQTKTMESLGTTYDGYLIAKKKKKMMDIGMLVGYGGGALVHITNMIHAACVKDDRQTNVTWSMAMIPTNEYDKFAYALGVGVKINL